MRQVLRSLIRFIKPATSPLRRAFRQSLRAAWENLPAIAALEAAMGLTVLLYYGSPAVSRFLSRFGVWEHHGGVFAAALASALAGGFLSELSTVYFLDRGRWTREHVENALFKLVLFFVSGAIVYEFYRMQAVWFGDRATWSAIVPKVLVDQFGYTVFWSVPTQTTLTRWHALGYSGTRLRQELRQHFITGRMLPVLFMNWMLWIPGVTFIYSMPQDLQMPLAIFANAIWGLLLTTAARTAHVPNTATVQDHVLPEVLPETD